jgi:hypothetical protein
MTVIGLPVSLAQTLDSMSPVPGSQIVTTALTVVLTSLFSSPGTLTARPLLIARPAMGGASRSCRSVTAVPSFEIHVVVAGCLGKTRSVEMLM